MNAQVMKPQFPADRHRLLIRNLINPTGTPQTSPAIIDLLAQGMDPILRKSFKVRDDKTLLKSDCDSVIC